MYRLDIPGWLSERELQLLEGLAAGVPAGGRMLEVGAYQGRSTYCLSRSAHPTVSVLTLDWFDPAEFPTPAELEVRFPGADLRCTLENFQRWTRGCENLSAQQVRYEERPDPGQRFDLIFLDASQANPQVRRNLRHYLTLLKPGGVLAGNGYVPSSKAVVQEVNAFVAATGCALERPSGSKLWICPGVSGEAIRTYGVPGGDEVRKVRAETPEDAVAMEREFEALLTGTPAAFDAETIAINHVLSQCAAPATFLDLGCWAGALSWKVVERADNLDQVLLIDASTSLTELAQRKVAERVARLGKRTRVKSWSRTIALRADQEQRLIAQRGATLINTSLFRKLPEEDAYLLNVGPVLTPQAFARDFARSIDGGYLKIDINGYEHRIIDEVVAQSRSPIAIHTKVSYFFDRTVESLVKAADHLGFLRPPAMLGNLKNAVGTCAISRNSVWCEFRDVRNLQPLFTYSQRNGVRSFLLT